MVIEREIRKLVLDSGRIPFDDWHQSLPDKKGTCQRGYPVESPPVGQFWRAQAGRWRGFGIAHRLGPGLRIYYGEHSGRIVLLLGGRE